MYSTDHFCFEFTRTLAGLALFLLSPDSFWTTKKCWIYFLFFDIDRSNRFCSAISGISIGFWTTFWYAAFFYMLTCLASLALSKCFATKCLILDHPDCELLTGDLIIYSNTYIWEQKIDYWKDCSNEEFYNCISHVLYV